MTWMGELANYQMLLTLASLSYTHGPFYGLMFDVSLDNSTYTCIRWIFFMAIAVASISTYVYKYVIHRIAISYAARGAISPKIMEKRHSLLCISPLYLYLYCIYFVLLYLQSTCVNKMRAYGSLFCFI